MNNTLHPTETQSSACPAVSEIVALHGQILTTARTTLDKAIRIGQLLTEQKASLKHGAWLPWVKENLPFDARTAQNYTRCYGERDRLKNENVSYLADAYRLLAEPAEPKSVTKGETPTPEELAYSAGTIVSAVRLFCDNELREVAKTIAGITGEPASDEEGNGWIRSLVACQRKAAKWGHYWADYTLRCERLLGQTLEKAEQLGIKDQVLAEANRMMNGEATA